MTRILEIQTMVLPGHRIEISSPELPEGRSATVRVTLDEPQPASDFTAAPEFAAAERRYLADLPQLLQTKPGRWVAYTAQGCLAEGEEELALFRWCERQGLRPEQFLVARVEPEVTVMDAPPEEFVE